VGKKKTIVNDLRYGKYEQVIGDTPEEAGHEELESGNREFCGWNMPADNATKEFLKSVHGKVIFELGPGNGRQIIRPSLQKGAKLVYAAEIDEKLIGKIIQLARESHQENKLRIFKIDKRWWSKQLLKNPTTSTILGDKNACFDGLIDLMMARHVLQFGSPNNFLKFLDFAEAALRVDGQAWGINMSPFLQYIYDCEKDLDGKNTDKGVRLNQIVLRNKQFAEEQLRKEKSQLEEKGEPMFPGGYVWLNDCLKVRRRRFLYFDKDTLTGLLASWRKSRRKRNLKANLIVKESFCFNPSSIWKDNKLVSKDEYKGRENHLFIIQKTS
jgi:hypothetical protein